MSRLEEFIADHPGAVVSIEGANEVDNYPVSYDGLTGTEAAMALQADLYAYVSGSDLLSGIPVYDLTGLTGGTDDADLTNVHTYPRNGNQPQDRLELTVENAEAYHPDRPLVMTEAGYYTLPGYGWGGVDGATQAKYTLNMLLDAARLGVDKIFLYELLNAYDDPAGTDYQKHFGLFDTNNNPKPVATAIHNLTTMLADDDSAATSFATASLDYTVSGLNSYGHSYLFEKADGTFDIALWYEVDIWDEVNLKPIGIADTPVTLTLGGYYRTVEILDPMAGTGAVQVLHDVNQLTLGINDHALIVELEPNGINHSPVISDVTSENVTLGDDFSWKLTSDMVSDADGDTLVFGASLADGSPLPSWLTFDASTGTFSGTAASLGSWSVLLTVADHYGGAASSVFQLVVQAADDEQTPTISGDGKIIGTTGNDVIAGGSGADTLSGAAGDDVVYGHGGNDLITGGAGIDSLYGNAGNDTLRGESGADRLFGGAGADTLQGGGGGFDILTGGEGADTFIFRGKETSDLAGVEGFTVVQHARLADLDFKEGDRLQLSYFVDDHGQSLLPAAGLGVNIASNDSLQKLVDFIAAEDPAKVIADHADGLLTLILNDSNGGLHALELLHYDTMA